ncbi:cadherin domain-containing protein [Allomuricauda sp. SCSIO 65647]|uniref:cadherin domain-containing protein n=1 Tax=Allomuricauda sp. SCSIO 65647 TaxID=2908843 RepID=UPI001F1FAEB0|nr:cadherin domain-containing protein [Muricauda sp. SCSIO 65647]UJH66666.1 cadherin domain-containing protein [Muricauda sp. SCSIO 65647]
MKKKLLFLSVLMVIASCSKDESNGNADNIPIDANERPLVLAQSFEIDENSRNGTSLGFVDAEDPDGDDITYSLERSGNVSSMGININRTSGELRVIDSEILDYETAQSISLQVLVGDGVAQSSATITIVVLDVEDGPLTNYQKGFLDEYHYLTFKLAPDAFGGTLSEKWSENIKLFLDGDFPQGFDQTVQQYLNEFNTFFDDGFQIELVATIEESNVHLIFGPASLVSPVWPDMYSLISGNNFGGYALYDTNGEYHIFSGRIWMGSESEALFKHELGHIIGLGHTSQRFCGIIPERSVMCSGAAAQFNPFDREIIKTLYRPEIEVGKNITELRPIITDLILNGDIVL